MALLEEAAAYIEEQSPSAARRLIIDAIDAAELLTTFPERGRLVPELHDSTHREVFVQRYRLIYEVTVERVAIVGFVHGARNFRSWWKAFKRRDPN